MSRVGVVGASGKTGRAVAAALVRRGVEPVPVGRAQWPDLAGALAGCEAAWVAAPNLHRDEPGFVGEVLDAVRSADVRHVVHHSVASPYAPAMPHHTGKAAAEDLVRRSGLAWTLLQPCAYVQNLLPALLGDEPALRVPYDVDVVFGLVDLLDVAEAAAVVLTEADHHGSTYELGGPALVSVRDVAAAASDVLGRPVVAERVEEHVDDDWLAAMFASYDRHGLPAGWRPLASLLGRRPTSVTEVLERELRRERGPAPAQPPGPRAR